MHPIKWRRERWADYSGAPIRRGETLQGIGEITKGRTRGAGNGASKVQRMRERRQFVPGPECDVTENHLRLLEPFRVI